MGLEVKSEKIDKKVSSASPKVLQRSPKVPSLRDVRPSVSANAPTLLAAMTCLPQEKERSSTTVDEERQPESTRV